MSLARFTRLFHSSASCNGRFQANLPACSESEIKISAPELINGDWEIDVHLSACVSAAMKFIKTASGNVQFNENAFSEIVERGLYITARIMHELVDANFKMSIVSILPKRPVPNSYVLVKDKNQNKLYYVDAQSIAKEIDIKSVGVLEEVLAEMSAKSAKRLTRKQRDLIKEKVQTYNNSRYLTGTIMAIFFTHLQRRFDAMNNFLSNLQISFDARSNKLFSDPPVALVLTDKKLEQWTTAALLVAMKYADDYKIKNAFWIGAAEILETKSKYNCETKANINQFEYDHLSAINFEIGVSQTEREKIFSEYFDVKMVPKPVSSVSFSA